MTPNKNFIRVLTRLYHILRQWKAHVWICHERYDRGNGSYVPVWINSLKIRLGDKVYELGVDVKEISRSTVSQYLTMDYITEAKLSHRAQAFIKVLDEFFRDTDLRITDMGAWSIRGTTYIGFFQTALSAEIIKDLIKLYTDVCTRASDMVKEFALLMQKYKAAITWEEDTWPAGGHGGSVSPTTVHYVILHVADEPPVRLLGGKQIQANMFDAMERQTLKDRGFDKKVLSFMSELYELMSKYYMAIGWRSNSLYMSAQNILVCDVLMGLGWLSLYSAWQHKGEV